MLYPSRYNVIVPDGNDVLLFNTHSLCFGRLSASLYHDALEMVESMNGEAGSAVCSDEVKFVAFEMRHKGFFVPDPVAESIVVAGRFEKRKNKRTHLGLTIAPTVDCNFSCPYCYEYTDYSIMPDRVRFDVAAYIDRTLASGRYKSMHVTWYGGEPLLEESFRALEFLSDKIITSCRNHSIPYSANIITNGYLLNRKTAEHLAAWNVSLAQITLDGPKELHDNTRTLKNGQGTFDRILQNIKENRDVLRFSIRMNVNEANASCVMQLKQLLLEEKILDDKGRVSFYVSPVRSYTSSCQSGDCLSNASFYRLQLDLIKRGINSDGFQVFEEYPVLKESICTAVGPDSYVIGPSGELYKCWLDLGRHEHSVGHIDSRGLRLNARINKWHDFLPFDEGSECASCTMLPVCMGGCPELNIRGRHESENQACCNWKYYLQEHLLYLASLEKSMHACRRLSG